MAHYAGVRRAYVYGLTDNTDRIRYVGKTTKVDDRLKQHLDEAKSKTHTHKLAWIRSLARDGIEPKLVVLESGDWTSAELGDVESRWIAELWDDLTNARPGGEGGWGHIEWTPERRVEVAERTRAWFASLPEDVRDGFRARAVINGKANLGRKHTPETRALISEYLRERWKNPEYRASMSVQLSAALSGEKNPCYGKKYTPEESAKMSAAVKKTRSTPASRKKSSDALKARWTDPEYREQQQEMYKRVWTPEKLKARGEAIKRGKARKALAAQKAESGE